MNRSEILARLTRCIASVLDQPQLAITMRTTADEIEGWDSFNHVNIVVAIENEFGINFNTAEMEELHEVGEIVKLIEAKSK